MLTKDDLNQSETADQVAAMKWLSYRDARAFKVTHHSPNGEERPELAGAKLKRMGTKPGFPDLITYLQAGSFTGLVIECKSVDGVLSDEQKFWLNHFEKQKYFVVVAVGLDQIIQAFEQFLSMVEWGD